MTILCRLPGHGWNPDYTMEPDELTDFLQNLSQGHRYTVATVDEFDYINALSLMQGKPIPVDFDPTDFRRTNVTQLRVLELNP